jgi:hypothetical protein
MTTTTPHDVPLPPETTCPDGWQHDDVLGTFRIVSGKDRWSPNRNIVIGTSAIQLVDGRIDDGLLDEGPTVWWGTGGSGGFDGALTPRDARYLGEALIAAAAELDGWVKR